MQDEDGQILEAHSISAGLDYPGTGPEHAWLRDSGRARTSRSPTRRRSTAFARRRAPGGDHPRARELARARLGAPEDGRASSTSCACSGRGDKDPGRGARASGRA